MGTIPASENVFPEILLGEVAAPSAAPSGQVRLYVKSDGLLYWKDDAGTERQVSVGDLAAHLADTSDAHDASAISIVDAGTHYTATDVEAALAEVMAAVGAGGIPATTIDAKGDLLVGTANDAIDNLTAGANGALLQALSSEATGLIWRAAPVAATVQLTSANYTGAGAAFAIITGATLSLTTLARRVRIHVIAAAQVGTAADAVALDVSIDGTYLSGGATNGLTGIREQTTGHRKNLSFTILSPVLSAGAHTIELHAKRIAGAGTITIFAASTDPLTFQAEETLLLV